MPKATPFLLSIKTMKSLGAMIDLGQNTCFLKTLQRSLYLKENKNGLFMIDMSDLCQPDVKSNAAAFVASSVCVPPPGLESEIPVSHADTPGVLDALRTVAEEVLASLKLLMTIVFTMTSAIDPNQEATELQMNPVNQLIHEVAQQRRTIDQLGNLIQAQFQQKPPTCPGPTVSPVNHVPGSEDFEWEAEMVPSQGQAASNGAKFFPIDVCCDDECQSSQQISLLQCQ